MLLLIAACAVVTYAMVSLLPTTALWVLVFVVLVMRLEILESIVRHRD